MTTEPAAATVAEDTETETLTAEKYDEQLGELERDIESAISFIERMKDDHDNLVGFDYVVAQANRAIEALTLALEFVSEERPLESEAEPSETE